MTISIALKDKLFFPKHSSPSRPKTAPSWMTSSYKDRLQKDRLELKESLDDMKLVTLKAIQKNRGWKLKGTLKAKIAEQLARRMADAADNAGMIQSLDDEHRHVLTAMSILGGEEGIRASDIERTAKSWGPFRKHDRIESCLSHLRDRGLIAPRHNWSNFKWVLKGVPTAMARQFPPLLEGLISSAPDVDFGKKESADPHVLVKTVNQIALLLERSPARLRPLGPRLKYEKNRKYLKGWNYDPGELEKRKEREWSQRNRDKIFTVHPPQRSLSDEAIERLLPLAGNEARLEFVFSLMKEIGLIENGNPATIFPKAKMRFFKLNEPKQRAVLARAYFHMENWSELWETLRTNDELGLKRNLKAGDMNPTDLSRVLLRFRRIALRALAALPDNMWIRVDELLGLMKDVIPRFDGNEWKLYRHSASYEWFISKGANDEILDLSDAEAWDSVVGDFIRRILAGPLRWLGLADGCFSKGALSAFRLRDFADLFHDRVEAPISCSPAPTISPGTKAVIVRGETIRIDPSRAGARAHGFLDEIASLGKADPDSFVFRLNRRRVHRFFESGKTLDKIIHDWKRFLRVPMPKKIQSRLSGWWASYGRVRIHQDIAVIEFGDDYTLAELKSHTTLEKHLIAEFPPGLAVVKTDGVEALRMELEKKGYLSKLTDNI